LVLGGFHRDTKQGKALILGQAGTQGQSSTSKSEVTTGRTRDQQGYKKTSYFSSSYHPDGKLVIKSGQDENAIADSMPKSAQTRGGNNKVEFQGVLHEKNG